MKKSVNIYKCIVLALSILIVSCQKKSRNEVETVKPDNPTKRMTSYKERFRPQFHFSPQENWMNDPNGLIYHNGIYHLFYQYYPEDIVWGPMHWGHAVSKDMIKWEHKPIALFPDEHGYIFSGSAVVDVDNTSGFGTEVRPPLVAIFTYHLMEGEQEGRLDFQTQGIAYSLDNGDSWQKFKGNPVISNDGVKDFRDPKVFWHATSKQWIMVLVAGDHVKFYSSSNLKEWRHLSDFGKEQGAHGGVWECPDLFKLKITETGEEKWVLLISVNPGAPNGGSGTQYFVGEFDGKIFKADHTDEKWLDYGRDNYAGVTYNDTPKGERIFIGWMSNWDYAQKTPTRKWRSAMTLPRNLSLSEENGNVILRSQVLASFDNYAEQKVHHRSIELENEFVIRQENLNQTEIKLKANLSEQLQFEFRNSKKEFLRFKMDPAEKTMSLDRQSSGLINFEKRFAGPVQKMPFDPSDKEVDLRFILDASSIEVFIEGGKYVMTSQIFPLENYTELKLSSDTQASLGDLQINHIKRIW